LNSNKAQGKAFVGSIEDGASLRLNGISLAAVSQIIVRVASAGAGGIIEVHRNKIDGTLLGSVSVEVNGEWETFSEKTITFPKQDGIDDLFFVFKNPKNRGGLMNIDSIEFLP
jgi:cytochrome c